MGLALTDLGRDPRKRQFKRDRLKTLKIAHKIFRSSDFSRHNSAMITNAENSRPTTGCLVSILTVRITSMSPLGCTYAVHQKEAYPNFRQHRLSDIVQ